MISRCRPRRAPDRIYRNAAADEVVFVHEGRGTLETMFGKLPFRARLRRHPARDDVPVRPERRSATRHRDAGPDRDPAALPQSRRPDQARLPPPARPPRAERAAHGFRPASPVTCACTDGYRTATYVGHPFDVVGWDGMALSHHVQRRRLRADHRYHPPPAPDPPDVRRPAS